MFIKHTSKLNVVLSGRFAQRTLLVLLVGFALLLNGCGNTISVENVSISLNPDNPNPSEIEQILPQKLSADFFVGDSVQLSVNAQNVNGSMVENILQLVNCSVETNAIVSVTNYCKLTALDVGEAAVLISLVNDSNISTSIKIKVLPSPASVSILDILPQPLLTDLFVGDSAQLSIKAENTDASIVDDALSLVTCSVQTNTVISVTEGCELTALSAGEADVKVTLTSNTAISSSIKIKVISVPALVSISTILPQALSESFFVGDTFPLAIKAKKSDGTDVQDARSLVTCSVVNNAVLSVTTDCQLTANAEGEVTVSIILKDDTTIFSSLKVKVLAVPVPVLVTSISPDPLLTNLFVDDTYQLRIKAKKSDGAVVQDALPLVTCSVVNESVATINSGCELTATGSGKTDVSISLKDNSEISAKLSIQVLPDIYFIENQVSVEAGKSIQLMLTGKYSNIESDNVDLFQWVKCSSNSGFFSVTESCHVTAISAGAADVSLNYIDGNQQVVELGKVTVTVTAPVTVTELIVTHRSAQLWVGSSKVLTLSAVLSDGTVLTDARGIAKCIDATLDTTIIAVNDDCTITGGVIGVAEVSAELKSLPTQAPTVTSFSLNVVTAPAILQSVPVSVAPGDYWFEYKFSEIDPSYTYKVKLVSLEVTPLNAPIIFTVKPAPELISSNKTCYNSLALDKTSIACGIDMSGTTGDLYVFLEHLDLSGFVNGFTGKLELSYDSDILNNDNQGAVLSSSVNDYLLLQAGTIYANGHVSSNDFMLQESRYHTNIDNGLIKSNLPGYRIEVVFKPDQAGDYHFDLNSVNVEWSQLLGVSEPRLQCTSSSCDCNIVAPASLICDVPYLAQEEIFVFVYGNGKDPFLISPATADGELSYSVTISNKF